MKKYPVEFEKIWKQVEKYTMTSVERGFALWESVNNVIDNKIPGAFVECGVWKGGSSMIIALTLLQKGVNNRAIYLFDTFEGMTKPTEFDLDHNGNRASELMGGKKGKDIAKLVEAKCDLKDVQNAMALTECDPRLIRYIKGDIKQTAQKTNTLQIALLRLDTDFYDSTKHELKHLYPRVSKNGIVIIDDYGHWKGAKKAVDEFLENLNPSERPKLKEIDYTGRIFTKIGDAKDIEIERYDYVPTGFADPKLGKYFPDAKEVNPWTIGWPYLRPNIPHKFRVDSRKVSGPTIGNSSYEEALCLYNIAKQFAGKRALEIGSHFGWTGAHLIAAGLRLECVDPAFSEPNRESQFKAVFDKISAKKQYKLTAGKSPDCIVKLAGEGTRNGKPEPWSFVFIDGDHDGEAPKKDALAVMDLCADDAIIMFHDLTSPYVADGLKALEKHGWNIGFLNTMQIMGVAWRGKVKFPKHIQDNNIHTFYVPHLAGVKCLSELAI